MWHMHGTHDANHVHTWCPPWCARNMKTIACTIPLGEYRKETQRHNELPDAETEIKCCSIWSSVWDLIKSNVSHCVDTSQTSDCTNTDTYVMHMCCLHACMDQLCKVKSQKTVRHKSELICFAFVVSHLFNFNRTPMVLTCWWAPITHNKSEESQNLKVQSGAPFDDEHAHKLFETRHWHVFFICGVCAF